MDYTGCGNTLNLRHPRALQLIIGRLTGSSDLYGGSGRRLYASINSRLTPAPRMRSPRARSRC